MSRFLAALLIPLVLANQGLCCVHAHGHLDAAGNTADRPHIHWAASAADHDAHEQGHGHRHSHSTTLIAEHGANSSQSEPSSGSHDDTAVLITARDTVCTERLSDTDWAQLLLIAVQPATHVVEDNAQTGAHPETAWLVIVRPPKVPIFLRDARFRC